MHNNIFSSTDTKDTMFHALSDSLCLICDFVFLPNSFLSLLLVYKIKQHFSSLLLCVNSKKGKGKSPILDMALFTKAIPVTKSVLKYRD